ncbi:MAG TPA: anti-sigma factor [Chitinophagaceae bacterium]
MNIKEYISSGIVESYVLGLAPEQERIEFEQLCLQYPELVAARNQFEEKLEKQAFEQAITPPSYIKGKVLDAIHERDSSENKAKVIAMDTRPQKNNRLRYVAAASVILFLVCAWFAYDLYLKNGQLKSSFSQLEKRVDSLNGQMAFEQKMMTMMTDPNVTVVSMVGTQQNPSSANIYWDTTSSNVFMVVKNIPKLPTEKQYQLWAFIKGKPVDLGLFDAPSGNNVMLQMKNTQKAEAFAITIENRGNGPTPQGPVETMGRISL